MVKIKEMKEELREHAGYYPNLHSDRLVKDSKQFNSTLTQSFHHHNVSIEEEFGPN